MKATILGGSGFIGSHLAAYLRANNHDCWLPERGTVEIFQRNLGTVFYCIGLTADFRSRPFATIDAHVGVLREVLEHARFDQLIYLSSTRVYAGCSSADENQTLRALPTRGDDLYNLSKMTGESLALASGRPCRVARLSNVLGPGMGATNFVGSVVDEARRTGAVCINTAPDSSKDYIWIDDVCTALTAVASRGQEPVYNIAGGCAISNQALADLLASRGIRVSFSGSAPTTHFPAISVQRLARDTGFTPAAVMPQLTVWLDGELAAARN